MDKNQIISTLRNIEIGYVSLSDDEIFDQIDAIENCGYEWTGKSFKHKKTSLFLKIEGLHQYSPDRIIETYNNVWSKSTFDDLKAREWKQKGAKSFLLFIISVPLLFFYDFKYVIGFNVLFFGLFLYARKMSKRIK